LKIVRIQNGDQLGLAISLLLPRTNPEGLLDLMPKGRVRICANLRRLV
jgi:hypothetical protein